MGESSWTTPAMDNRSVDQFVSEDFELDTDHDSESDTEDEHKTKENEVQIITDE